MCLISHSNQHIIHTTTNMWDHYCTAWNYCFKYRPIYWCQCFKYQISAIYRSANYIPDTEYRVIIAIWY